MSTPISEGKRDKNLTIRVNEGQLRAIKLQAEKYHVSQSNYLMSLVEKDILKDKQSILTEGY